jgi:hypothetical protein
VVGRRSYQSTLALFRDIAERANPEDIALITTDGFEFYERVIGQVFGPACVYGQVIKTRRNNRIVKVERRAVIGTQGRFDERLQRSEDSSPEACLGLSGPGSMSTFLWFFLTEGDEGWRHRSWIKHTTSSGAGGVPYSFCCFVATTALRRWESA